MDPETWLKLFEQSKGTPLSGEKLSRKLHLSRTAIWKQIKNLRTLGYEIQGERAKGYQLLSKPNIPYPWEIQPHLKTKIIAKKIDFFEEIDSTNRKAQELARVGAPEGTVVITDSQTEGRGRRGRQWFSPPGANLYTSIILRPKIEPSKAPQMTLVAGVAAREAIEKSTGLSIQLKWPNDLWYGGKKLGGILTELHSDTDMIHFVVVGIGININVPAAHFPKELKKIATSLSACTGKECSRTEIARNLYESLDAWYRLYLKEGFEPVRVEWEKHSMLRQVSVTIDFLDSKREGIALGLDEMGGLIVKTKEGSLETILSGDIQVKVNR